MADQDSGDPPLITDEPARGAEEPTNDGLLLVFDLVDVDVSDVCIVTNLLNHAAHHMITYHQS